MSDEQKRLDAIREVLSAIPSATRLPVGAILELLGPAHPFAGSLVTPMTASPAEQIAAGAGEITVREAADNLGISPQAVIAAMNRGDVVGRRVGPICLIQANSVKDFGARRMARSSEARSATSGEHKPGRPTSQAHR